MPTKTKARLILEQPIAAEKGQLEVVRFLVESGANEDQGTTDDGATPLYIAAEKGHLEVVRFLVESGANKEIGIPTPQTSSFFPHKYHQNGGFSMAMLVYQCVITFFWGDFC